MLFSQVQAHQPFAVSVKRRKGAYDVTSVITVATPTYEVLQFDGNFEAEFAVKAIVELDAEDGEKRYGCCIR